MVDPWLQGVGHSAWSFRVCECKKAVGSELIDGMARAALFAECQQGKLDAIQGSASGRQYYLNPNTMLNSDLLGQS